MLRKLTLGAAILGLVVCTAALAQERKVYKYVDEKGNVVYSQTPPLDASKARKIDATPAYSGRGGNSPSVSPYDNARTYSGDTGQQQYRDALRERQQRQEEARKNRLTELEAECNRNRGTDCKNPDTLRYQESTQIPRRSRR
jgi:uncharacterized protein DUF4124